MGLFDTFKGMVQAVTGGAARVAIEFDPLGFAGEDVRVRVSVTSTGGEVKSQGVFVDILGSEQIKVPAASVASAAQNTSRPMAEALPTGHQSQLARDVEVNHVTCSQSFQIAPAFVLTPGESRQFEGTIRLPQGIQPTYHGRHAQHSWHIRGRLESWGNDPDSGYQPLRVGARGN
jgi:hypothetical protein